MNFRKKFFIFIFFCFFFATWKFLKYNDKFQFNQQRQFKRKSKFPMKEIFDQEILDYEKEKKIIVKSDVLELKIDISNGNIEQAFLLSYFKELGSKEPFQLLQTTDEFIYQAKTGLIVYDNLNNLDKISYPFFKAKKNEFTILENQNELVVPMSWIDSKGNIFIKTLTLKRNEYAIKIEYFVKNTGNEPLLVSEFGQLKQSVKPIFDHKNKYKNSALHTFRGAVFSTPKKKYEKYKFDNIVNSKKLTFESKIGWIAMLQQYFASALIPNDKNFNTFYSDNFDNKIAIVGYKSHPILINPGKTSQFQSTLWIGPKIQEKMASISPNLNLIVDYGWLWFIAKPLFNLLCFINNSLKNWGFSIILITFIIRGIMYPFNKAQYVSMAKIRMLQPKIQTIRKQINNDKQRQNQEIMMLYKSEKINPIIGVVLILIQIPIFLALYYVLIDCIELRHAPFIFWINDLSSKDPYYILPIFMGITMFFMQKTSPNSIADSSQKKITSFVPIVFVLFFLWFPSGLVLYYIVSNIVTIIQQKLIYCFLKKNNFYKHLRNN